MQVRHLVTTPGGLDNHRLISRSLAGAESIVDTTDPLAHAAAKHVEFQPAQDGPEHGDNGSYDHRPVADQGRVLDIQSIVPWPPMFS